MRAQYQRSRRGFSSEIAIGLVQGSLAPNLVDLHESLAQPFDPVGLVHAHQADAPGESVASASGHASRNQGVENGSLLHPQPRHDGEAQSGEHPRLVPAAGAPSDLAPEPAFSLPGDLDAVFASLFSEAVDPGHPGGFAGLRSGAGGKLNVGQLADDQYLLAVGGDLRRAGEPGLGQAAGEPGADILAHRLHHYAQAPRSARRVTILTPWTCPPGAPSCWQPPPPPE